VQTASHICGTAPRTYRPPCHTATEKPSGLSHPQTYRRPLTFYNSLPVARPAACAGASGARCADVTGLEARTVRIARQLTQVRGGGFTFGPPKSRAGTRVVPIPEVILPVLQWYLHGSDARQQAIADTLSQLTRDELQQAKAAKPRPAARKPSGTSRARRRRKASRTRPSPESSPGLHTWWRWMLTTSSIRQKRRPASSWHQVVNTTCPSAWLMAGPAAM
jgi:hypothetical protein